MFKDNIPHQKLVLDINQTNSFETLEMKQGDKGSRYVDITLVADGAQLHFTAENTARLVASNSGTLLQNEVFEIDENSTITVEVNENALALDGVLDCEVVIYDVENNRLTSATFNIRVGKSSIGGKSVVVDALEKSVKEEHLDDGSVSSRTIAKGAVLKEHLASVYVETKAITIHNYDALDLIVADSETGLGDMVYYVTFNESKFPDYDLVGDYGYLCVPNYKNKDSLLLINCATGEVLLYKKGTSTLERRKIGSDEIAEKAVDTEQLATEAVTTGKIKDKAITAQLIADDAVTNAHLVSTYWEKVDMYSIMSYSFLDSLLDEASDGYLEGIVPRNTIYKLRFGSEFPRYGLLGGGEYIGIPFSTSEYIVEPDHDVMGLLLISLDTGKRFNYIRGGTLTELEANSHGGNNITVDQIYDPKSENAQSGMAVNEAISNYAATKKVINNPDSFNTIFSHSILHGSSSDVVKLSLSEDLLDTKTGIVLNAGEYIVFGDVGNNRITCLSLTENVMYLIEEEDYVEDDGSVGLHAKSICSSKNISDIGGFFAKDNVDDALQELGSNICKHMPSVSTAYLESKEKKLANVTENIMFYASKNWLDCPDYQASGATGLFINLQYRSDYRVQVFRSTSYNSVYTRFVNNEDNSIKDDWKNTGFSDFLCMYAGFPDKYERSLAKVPHNGWFAIMRTDWDDLPEKGSDSIFFNYTYTANYKIQFLVYWKTGYIFYRIVHAKNYSVYQDWKAIGGTPEPMKVLAIGDSICRGNRNSNKGFVGDLGLPYQNAGVSGASISNVVTSYTNIPTQLVNFHTANNTDTGFKPDIIIAEGGINDYFYDAPMGTLSAVPVTTDEEAEALDRSTVLGGMEYLFYQMVKLYPKAQRFFVITHKTWKTNESMYCPATANTQGWTQQDLHDFTVKCCNLYNVKVIDIYEESMINSLFPQYRSAVSYSSDSAVTNTEYVDYDGVHPLAYGYVEGYVPLIKKAIGLGTVK